MVLLANLLRTSRFYLQRPEPQVSHSIYLAFNMGSGIQTWVFMLTQHALNYQALPQPQPLYMCTHKSQIPTWLAVFDAILEIVWLILNLVREGIRNDLLFCLI